MRRWIMLIVAALLMAAPAMLAGCAAGPHVDIAPPPPQIVTVDRLVSTPCVRRSDIPAAPPPVGDALTGDAVQDLAVLAETVLALRAWQGKAAALLAGCAG